MNVLVSSLGSIALGLATLCYIIFSLFSVLKTASSFLAIALFSFIPFGVGVWSLRKYLKRSNHYDDDGVSRNRQYLSDVDFL